MLVLIELCGQRYALAQPGVREILPLPRLSRPPGLPRALAGFFSLAGVAVPVLALHRLLGLCAAEGAQREDGLYAHLVLVDACDGERPVALLVDRVLDARPVPKGRLGPVPPGDTLNGCVEAEAELDGALVPVLAIDRLLLAQERQALADLGRQAQERLGEWTFA